MDFPKGKGSPEVFSFTEYAFGLLSPLGREQKRIKIFTESAFL